MSDQPRREKPVSRHSRRRGTDNSDSTDFDKLSRCAEHEIHEGTVLFAGRIVEKELELALQAHRLPPSGNLYGNILRLRFMGLAPTAVIDAANALRLASNAIRHAQRDAQAGDGDLAIALIRIVLDWRKMAASGLPKARHAPVQAFVDALMGVPLEPRRLLDRWSDCAQFLNGLTVPRGLCVERLVAAGGYPVDALRLIDEGLSQVPGDRRLRQMRALVLRRTGDTTTAVQILDELHVEDGSDAETAGLLAAIHKRNWRDGKRPDEERVRSLERAAKLYLQAWKRSGHEDTYTGINAASLLRARGDVEGSREAASTILAQYQRRYDFHGRARYMDYWDQATHAEALLLAHQVEEARELWSAAARAFASERDSIASSREQLDWLLPMVAPAFRADAFLDAVDPRTLWRPAPPTHQAVPALLVPALDAAAARIHDRWAQKRFDEGWQWGPARDDTARTHPCLVPYADLPESEKEYDRATAAETILALLDAGFGMERR